MNYKIVVSKFDENTEWVKTHNPSNYVIYDKGSTQTDGCIKLPNVGSHQHSYLRYIVENYTRLPDLVIFTQANPFIYGLDLSSFFSVEPFGYSNWIQDLSRYRWGNHMSNDENFRISHWKGSISNPKGWSLGAWWEKTTDEKYSKKPKIFWSSIFSVKKELILNRSIASYIKICESMAYDPNPVEAHYCERTWLNIFNITS